MQTSALDVFEFYRAAPGGVPTQRPFSQERRYPCSTWIAPPA